MTSGPSPAGEAGLGCLYGVGVGPGDPELMTVKAVRLLREAAVLAYLQPNDGPSLARSIAAVHLDESQSGVPTPPAPRPGAVELPLPMPIRRDRAPGQAAYDRAAERLLVELQAGRDVAFLCEGDPLLYGSFIQLLQRLGDRVPVQVVPGVTSALAAAAAARLPLAVREDSWSVVPATLSDAALTRCLQATDTAALLKAGPHLPRLGRLLTKLRLLERAWYAERIGQAGERLEPLAPVLLEKGPEGTGPYFSLILIGRPES